MMPLVGQNIQIMHQTFPFQLRTCL